MEKRPTIRRVAANILNKQSRTADKEWSSSLGLEERLTNSHRKNWHSYETNISKSILFLSFRRVLNVNYSFLGNSPASEF